MTLTEHIDHHASAAVVEILEAVQLDTGRSFNRIVRENMTALVLDVLIHQMQKPGRRVRRGRRGGGGSSSSSKRRG